MSALFESGLIAWMTLSLLGSGLLPAAQYRARHARQRHPNKRMAAAVARARPSAAGSGA